MPIFEYQCIDCGQQFEHLQRSGAPEPQCPGCGQSRLTQMISLCGVGSEERSAANLNAAHQRAAARREDKHRAEHRQHHDHFGDTA